MRRCKMNEHKLSIILLNIKNYGTLSHNTSRISIHNNKNTVRKGGVENFEAEENNKEEEDLVVEDAKSYVITVEI